MASSHDFFLHGDHAAGRAVVAETLSAQEFIVTETPKGGLLAKRGSAPLTILFGAMAGAKFQMVFLVDFMVDASGRLVVRLHRNMTSGALKGGAIGASKTNTAFEQTANALAEALHTRGLLAESISN
ncbi:hypothetical protein [Arthrobacter sp. NPDC090010]|uniref:hypothetical protein n=1 Tax=Arthrobacter sp. NPDC090010 TaxID=3363942 RepID=UPI00381DB38F